MLAQVNDPMVQERFALLSVAVRAVQRAAHQNDTSAA
jgi:hypothetical protein